MTQTYVTKVEVVNRTQVKKITIGTPIRKVTGAAAQGLNDLTDVNFGDLLADKVQQILPPLQISWLIHHQ